MSKKISRELTQDQRDQRSRFARWFFCNAPLLREARRVMIDDIEGRRRLLKLLRGHDGEHL
jgi:hypothetical protein